MLIMQRPANKNEERQNVRKCGLPHAVAILEATVRSLSSFALLRSKACCRQSSKLLQL
jgi:hypothetical protein